MESKLREDLKQAQLNRDEVKVATLRLLLSEITYARVDKKTEILSDEDITAVILKAVKQRKESIESFKSGGREDLASKEESELEILQTYLPEQMSDEELTKVIDEAITKVTLLSGESKTASMQDMGKVIGMVMGQVGAKAEGAKVSSLVRQKLTMEDGK